jgi:hypothetical protein
MIPDVVAYPLEEAASLLAAAGVRVVGLRETAAPQASPGGGVVRVVRQREVGDREVELVVTREVAVRT